MNHTVFGQIVHDDERKRAHFWIDDYYYEVVSLLLYNP